MCWEGKIAKCMEIRILNEFGKEAYSGFAAAAALGELRINSIGFDTMSVKWNEICKTGAIGWRKLNSETEQKNWFWIFHVPK